ncbi:lanthionine synthetase LanC family protein [Tenacibaculum sp. TC6]|uniref:lanthionine synthetase LanC family protein n=1 Tax=Tenacibaculum sp. TC6 TaxID=3423223 RepID=UPI003D35A14E
MGANIFFLTKVLTKDYIEDSVKSRIITIIDNAIQFFLKYEQQINEKIFSFYPVKMEYEDYVNKNIVIQNSRLGWCYGDLGILYTLLFASKKIHNESYVSKIVEMLKHVASRKFEDENHKKFIIDAGFCHGTSGIAILFRNIYDITGDDLFLKTSNYWIEKTLVQRKKEQGEDSIDYGLDIKGTDKQNISVLEGLAGILLCYNKFLGKDTTASEELLMIKY